MAGAGGRSGRKGGRRLKEKVTWGPTCLRVEEERSRSTLVRMKDVYAYIGLTVGLVPERHRKWPSGSSTRKA